MMTIASESDYIASAKQNISVFKSVSRTAVAASWFSIFDLAGNPGAGTLAGSSVAAGVVPTDAVAGYPTINAFGGSAKGYLAGLDFGSSVACRIAIFDRLWLGGAYAFNAAQTLASQPSYSSRVPGGTDFKNLELWLEQVTASTGIQNVTVTYTDQDANAAQTTGAVTTAANIVGRCWQLPLANGDSGLTKVETVTGAVATAGTFNIMVLRRLWQGRVRIANDGDVHDLFKLGLPQIYEDSALYAMICPDSTATGIPEVLGQVAVL